MALFCKPQFNDATLVLLEKGTEHKHEFPVHRAILANISPFFLELFSKDTSQSRFDLEVPSIIKAIDTLRWVYSRNPFPPKDIDQIAKEWTINLSTVTYSPLIRGQFIVTKHDDNCLHYYSIVKGSWIHTFELIKLNGNDLFRFYCFFPNNMIEIRKYFKMNGIYITKEELENGYIKLEASEYEKIKTILKLILKDNEFKSDPTEDINRWVHRLCTLTLIN